MRAFKKRPGNLGRLFPDPVIDYKRRAAGERDDPGRAGDEDQQPASIQPGPIFEDEDWPTEKDAPVEEGQEKPARLHGPENQNPAQDNVEGRFRRLSAKFDVDSGQAIDKATNRTTDGPPKPAQTRTWPHQAGIQGDSLARITRIRAGLDKARTGFKILPMARVSSFPHLLPNDQREILLKAAFQEIVDQDGIPFLTRGNTKQVDWAELQRRIDLKAGRAAGS